MKKLALLLFFAVLTNVQLVKGQDLESQELLKLRNQGFVPIGESNGHVFYYSWMRFKADLKITVYKYKEENLELVDTKEIFIKDIKPKTFISYRCKIDAYYKNNKFYFFYSLLYRGDFHIGLTTIDENSTNTQDLQLGTMLETGPMLQGDFFVSLSPDNKTAIVALKNMCEQKKTFKTYTTINFENTELVYVDLITNKINYSKRLPIEMQEARLSTSHYKTDNDGNVTFTASLSERKGGNVVLAVGIGMLNKSDEKIKITAFDITGSRSISSDLIQTKVGDLIYVASLNNKTLFKILSMDKSKKWVETSFADKKLGGILFKITEAESGYYLNYSSFNSEYFSVSFISKTGELKWSKQTPTVNNYYIHTVNNYFTSYELKANAISYKTKEYLFCLENRPEEITPKVQKAIDKGEKVFSYDLSKFHTVAYFIDENGAIEKKVIRVHSN